MVYVLVLPLLLEVMETHLMYKTYYEMYLHIKTYLNRDISFLHLNGCKNVTRYI